MRRFITFGPAFVVLLTTGAVLLAVPSAMRTISALRAQERVQLARQSLASDDILERINDAVRNVAASVEPSVVHVEMRRWRGASGAGWVFDDAGHIITNAHVVGPVSRVAIQFHDGRLEEGTVIGADPLSDIAVIKVEPGDHLIPARRASGERVERGDRVFAFGSPFGFKFSMSSGIVSGLGRSARSPNGMGISNFIQTDAAVNPGNSGGPLVDVQGRVVGMNVAIATASETDGGGEGQSAGISFAIPLATIESRVAQLIETGTIRQGYLGVQFSLNVVEVDNTIFRGKGVKIEAVVPGGPSDRGGVREDDIVLEIDGMPVEGPENLRSIISAKRPGAEVTLLVLRNDRERVTLKFALGEMPDEVFAGIYADMLATQGGILLRDTEEGVTVARVLEGSRAAEAGFAQGQVVIRIDDQEVSDTTQAVLALQREGAFLGRSVEVRVRVVDKDGNTVRRDLTLDLRDLE
jgi:S1-C subfamily serine protease